MKHLNNNGDDAKAGDLEPNHLDGEIRAAVASVEPPEWLKESILSQCAEKEQESKVIRPVFKFSAIAAMLLIVCTLGFFGLKILQNDQLAPELAFREATASYIASGGFLFDFNNSSLEDIQTWLIESGGPAFENLPNLLASQEPIGCKKLEWGGQVVSLVCFHLPEGGIVHMFIVPRVEETDALFADIESVRRVHDLETAGWKTQDKIYVLTGSDPDVSVVEFLQGA